MLKNTLLACLLVSGLYAETKVETKAADPTPAAVMASQPQSEVPPTPEPERKHHWYDGIAKAFQGGGDKGWTTAAPGANTMTYTSTVLHQDISPTRK